MEDTHINYLGSPLHECEVKLQLRVKAPVSPLSHSITVLGLLALSHTIKLSFTWYAMNHPHVDALVFCDLYCHSAVNEPLLCYSEEATYWLHASTAVLLFLQPGYTVCLLHLQHSRLYESRKAQEMSVSIHQLSAKDMGQFNFFLLHLPPNALIKSL